MTFFMWLFKFFYAVPELIPILICNDPSFIRKTICAIMKPISTFT